MPEAKLQAGGRGWRDPDLTEAHRALMAADGCLLRAAALARGKLDQEIAYLRQQLAQTDADLYRADQEKVN